MHLMARVDEHVQNVYALGKATGPDGKWVDMAIVKDCLEVSSIRFN